MSPEEQGQLLSAYLDDELDEARREEVEALLSSDESLAQELEEMASLGTSLKDALFEEADRQDFHAMEEAVLEQVASARKENAEAIADSGGSWLDSLKLLFQNPVVAFALGLFVAGIWGVNWTVLEPVNVVAPTGASAELAEDSVPVAPRRAPESEQSFAKASPSLVLERLSVEKGKVVLDHVADDPDAPVVLWHFSDSATNNSDESPMERAPEKSSEPVEGKGDPL